MTDTDQIIIFCDSLSVLQSLHNMNITNPLIQKVLIKHTEITVTKNIVLCWIPSHIGISGNEMADKAAKESLDLNISNCKVPHTDSRQSIFSYIKSKWQTSWDNIQFNKLQPIKPIIGESSTFRTNRKEEITLARLRIGHTRLTHSFLLKREDKPQCIPCDADLNVEHILIHCIDLALVRQNYFDVTTLKELFDSVDHSKIIGFLKECQLYHKV